MVGLILNVVLAITIGASHAALESHSCIERSTRYGGDTLVCPQDYVATALCTSGKLPDCSGAQARLKCCPNCGSFAMRNGNKGRRVFCPHGMGVTGVCTSRQRADCGRNEFTRIHCLDGLGLTLTSRCRWLSARNGVWARCAYNEIMTGVASSGKLADTDDGFYTNVRCCVVE